MHADGWLPLALLARAHIVAPATGTSQCGRALLKSQLPPRRETQGMIAMAICIMSYIADPQTFLRRLPLLGALCLSCKGCILVQNCAVATLAWSMVQNKQQKTIHREPRHRALDLSTHWTEQTGVKTEGDDGRLSSRNFHYPNWKQMRRVQHLCNHRAQSQTQKQATRGAKAHSNTGRCCQQINSARPDQWNPSMHAQRTKLRRRKFNQSRRRRRVRPRVESAQARIRGQPQRRQTHRVRGWTAEINSYKFCVRRNQCNMHQAHNARSWA